MLSHRAPLVLLAVLAALLVGCDRAPSVECVAGRYAYDWDFAAAGERHGLFSADGEPLPEPCLELARDGTFAGESLIAFERDRDGTWHEVWIERTSGTWSIAVDGDPDDPIGWCIDIYAPFALADRVRLERDRGECALVLCAFDGERDTEVRYEQRAPDTDPIAGEPEVEWPAPGGLVERVFGWVGLAFMVVLRGLAILAFVLLVALACVLLVCIAIAIAVAILLALALLVLILFACAVALAVAVAVAVGLAIAFALAVLAAGTLFVAGLCAAALLALRALERRR